MISNILVLVLFLICFVEFCNEAIYYYGMGDYILVVGIVVVVVCFGIGILCFGMSLLAVFLQIFRR